MSRTIYFVRHGESEHNREQVVQDGENSLSQLGVIQAQKLAQRFEHIKVDAIFSSTYQRALETAQIINERVNVPLQVFEQLRETQIFPSRSYIGQTARDRRELSYKGHEYETWAKDGLYT
jgi:broad specificity phosphatase PhoE